MAPALQAAKAELEKAKIEDALEHKIAERPSRKSLEEQNILKHGAAGLQAAAEALKKAQLEDDLAKKLARRPSENDPVVQKVLA